ncbi:type II toxin-antitoxin system VapC family toxin [Niveispirillum sp. SYP-B3756]|uniref:type II toxin-antitoxin system VapC family toxin n=1 Tax=Niveispirillum sp. SYP-B3756 TaxID=2662178 RepID=UPI001B3BC43A|nr:type II toxin-antitoxin system VapC family toxin [Niveispirillum sp. SYP-B3756]
MPMIAIDSSAVYAILCGEADAGFHLKAIRRATALMMSAMTAFECRTVMLRRFGMSKVWELDAFLDEISTQIMPFDEAQAGIAFTAYGRYGRGSGHPAQLNYGDCAAYALSRSADAPLLFKGQDFIHTDIIAALPLLVPEAGISQ